MIAPAATFSGDWATGISEAISIGTTTPPVPQISVENGASTQTATAARSPPVSLKPTATSNRRRSLPHRFASMYRNPNFTSASSIVRSSSV